MIQSQARRDAVRSRLFKPRPDSTAPVANTDDALDLRLSQEMAYARRLLEELGDRLVNDPIIIQRHTEALQGIDLIGQLLGHLSEVIAAADRPAAVERIGMQDLKTRLRRTALAQDLASPPGFGSRADRT